MFLVCIALCISSDRLFKGGVLRSFWPVTISSELSSQHPLFPSLVDARAAEFPDLYDIDETNAAPMSVDQRAKLEKQVRLYRFL